MVEKMMLVQKDGKLKDIKMFGQITLNGQFVNVLSQLHLVSNNWASAIGTQKRSTPNSIPTFQITDNEFQYQFAN